MSCCFQCHSNESLASVRARVADRMKQSADNVQIVARETLVNLERVYLLGQGHRQNEADNVQILARETLVNIERVYLLGQGHGQNEVDNVQYRSLPGIPW